MYLINESTDKKLRIALILLAVGIMVSLIIIPFSTGWLLGLMPDADEMGHALKDVMEKIADNGRKAFNNIVVRGTFFAAVWAIALFISAIVKCKPMNAVASFGGTYTMIRFLIKYISLNDFDAVFDFENCGTTIGFWIPLILYLLCIIISLLTLLWAEPQKREARG